MPLPAKPQLTPKMAAIMALVAAVLTLATMYVPALQPICQAFGGCQPEPTAAPVAL